MRKFNQFHEPEDATHNVNNRSMSVLMLQMQPSFNKLEIISMIDRMLALI